MPKAIPSSTLEKLTTFGDLLRFLRRRADMTQMELAIAVGYSDAQISRLEQNRRLPDIPTIEARFIPALGLEDQPAAARLLDLAANVRREDAPASGLCPYKGLSYFDETDADWFVGREALTARLAEQLLALTESSAPSTPRFLAVVGASGSGKSSVVRAGLVPSLRQNSTSAGWIIHILTPTAHPLESLALTLTQETGSAGAAARLIDDLASEPRSLHLFAARETKSRNVARLLLVVDQFEEVFALCRSEEERSTFIDGLLAAASEADGPVLVVITLRADYYAHCAGYVPLREALAHQQEYIGAMNREELRRAIEEPARRGRWELEPGLVDLLLRDVGQEPGALPLLSHALLETWQRRRGRLMTLSGYAASGGVRGAIAETAEAVFADQFTQEQRAIARRLFLRLTELGDESAGGDTRRRATFSELIPKPEEAAPTLKVLKALADARLIITSEDSAEVAHEALIREWPTLRGWLEDDRECLRLHRQLTDAAQEWATGNHEPDLLVRGARLAHVGEWAQAHQDEMNDLEREFLAASQALAEQEASEREAQHQRELDTARKLAEAERRRAQEQAQAAGQLRKRALYLATALLVAIVLAATTGWMGWQAHRAGQVAASRELAAAAIANLDVDPERSILLALEAVSAAHTLEAEDALHQSILASRVRLTLPAHEPGAPTQVAYSPDGSRLATASEDETVKLWDSASGELLYTIAGHAVAFRPDGKQLATVLPDQTVRLWDAETGAEIPLAGPIDAGDGLMFSPDGSRLVTVTPVNLPRIWDLRTAQEVVSFPGHSDYVSFAIFDPDGARLLSTSDDGTARVWDTSSGQELLKLEHPGWVWTAAFSPDGKRIATLSGNQAIVWDAASGARLLTLNAANTLYAIAFSPDGTRLATGGLDRKATLWDAATGAELLALAGHSGAVTGLAFGPDGTRLASTSDDGALRTWDLTPGSEAPVPPAAPTGQIAYTPDGTRLAGIRGPELMLWDAQNGAAALSITLQGWSNALFAFSPDGKLLATASGPNATLRDAATGRERSTWPAHTGRINALAFDPSGRRLATAGDDYKVKVWDALPEADQRAESMAPALTLDLPAEVDSLAFSPDGARLAAGVRNGTAKIWDLASGQELRTLRGHSDSVLAVAFGPDGKRLATASLDGTGKVWDVATGRERFTLAGQISAVPAIVFSPDGTRLATVSRDGAARLWDAQTGQEMLTLPGNGAALNNAIFDRDGRRLVVSGEAGISAYLLDLDDLAALARNRVTRRLTTEECQKYLHHISNACGEPPSVPTVTPLPPAANGRICQVTNTAGLNDDYFNALMYKGVQDAASLYGWEPTVLQPTSTSDFENKMRALLDRDCRLIVAPVSLFETVQNAARTHPEQKFMMMDFVYDPPLENIWNQLYATDQAAFLAGYVAASVTRTGKVGVFGGVDIPQVTDFMDGLALGVDYYNQEHGANVQVLGWNAEKHEGRFVGGFCCSTEGRHMARQLLDEGADIIVPVAGKSVGWGAGAEVQAQGNAWLIGVDNDWARFVPEFADVTLTSIEKRFDASIVQASQAIAAETFRGGSHLGTLETGEVGLAPFYGLDGLISGDVKTDLEQIAQGIISGQIRTRP